MDLAAPPMVRAFRESRDIAADGPELRRRMEADGYLFVPGLLPRGEVSGLRRQFQAIAAEAGWLRAGTPPDQSIADPAAACVDPEPGYVAVLKRLYRLEALHAIGHHPAVIELLERMLGEAVLPHPRLVLRNVFPQRPDYTTPAHQDFPHIQGTTETYSVWLPLGDCPVERGGLAIAEGSHHDGVVPFRVSSGAGGMEAVDPYEGRWVAGDFAEGDAIIFHSLVVHKALPNVSDRLRQSVDNRYQRVSDPIVAASLAPYANILSWDEIYAGWRETRLQRYWEGRFTNIVPFDNGYYEERDRMAFRMAEAGDGTARATLLRIVQRDADPRKRERASLLLQQLERVA
jgi:hypothetical protein